MVWDRALGPGGHRPEQSGKGEHPKGGVVVLPERQQADDDCDLDDSQGTLIAPRRTICRYARAKPARAAMSYPCRA